MDNDDQQIDNDENTEKVIYKDISSTEKWLIAVLLGVIFLIVASPLIFQFSDTIFGYVGWNTVRSNGKPTPFGWILHMLAFILIVRILMA